MPNITEENNKRIAKNALYLYLRMFLVLIITLYTSRVILNVLGVEDYGIYNVVGGIVTLFSVLSGTLAAAISRFLTFELGLNNKERLKTVFSTSVTVQIILSITIFIFAEIGGIWFLNTEMNIPSVRLHAANWVLQCSILTFIMNLLSVPYNAAIIAHEHMKSFAYIGIMDVILKLGIVLSLFFCNNSDKLVIYAILLLIEAVFIRFIYIIYCKKKFEECIYHFCYDKNVLKEIGSFASWNFIGSSSGILRDHGVNILLNIYGGPIINAARGIAYQVSSAALSLISNLQHAINPQITKSYATNNHKYMITLSYQGARIGFYLLLLCFLPILIDTNTVLYYWLNNVPEHTVTFVRLIIILVMSDAISQPLITIMLATGNIRNYQIIVGGLQILNFPLSYIFLKLGFTPEITMVIAIFISQLCLFARLLMLNRMINFPILLYIKKVYINVICTTVIALLLPFTIFNYISLDHRLMNFVSICLLSLLSTIISIYLVGCSNRERAFINHKIHSLIKKK
ncbi:MAG: lipopolysaccharide biosynthesis protein [Bacteroidaceae bacterium]|nr:lipopolysaccharide biosynthesis protein [Bacteroidaceae bacterium]